jgi:hypothetical protein
MAVGFDVLLNWLDNVLGPLTTDHAPVPTVGVLPDKVAVLVTQIDWVEPLVAVVGFALMVNELEVPVVTPVAVTLTK